MTYSATPHDDRHEVKRPNAPSSALQEAVQALAQARSLADEVQDIVSQLCGTQPYPERDNSEVSPDGLLPVLADDARRTKVKIEQAQDALSRIRKMV